MTQSASQTFINIGERTNVTGSTMPRNRLMGGDRFSDIEACLLAI